MFPAFVLRCLASIIVILSSVVSLSAAVEEEEWARAMVDKDLLKINFKSVAKGQDVSFKIPVKNIYNEDMKVISLSTSCGCISWNENRPGPNGVINPIIIPSGQTQILTLTLDTIKHPGEHKGKKAVITFFEPTKGAVGTATIVVEGYVRTDVVLQPGSVNFGSVDPNKGAEQRITVNYAGRNDWRLISADFTNSLFSAEIIEKSRGNGLVNYDLIVKLKETAPFGHLRDQMMLVTDDANNPQIPVQVYAKIEPEYVVTEANFGTLTPGKAKEIQVLVRYTKLPVKPFKIEKVERSKGDSTIKVKKSDEAKPLHQLTLTFTPPNIPGKFEEEFYLTISGQLHPITFKASGRILEAPVESK